MIFQIYFNMNLSQKSSQVAVEEHPEYGISDRHMNYSGACRAVGSDCYAVIINDNVLYDAYRDPDPGSNINEQTAFNDQNRAILMTTPHLLFREGDSINTRRIQESWKLLARMRAITTLPYMIHSNPKVITLGFMQDTGSISHSTEYCLDGTLN